MVQRKQYLTAEGYEKLQQELEELRTVRRREVAERLKLAAEVGGTVDNAEYDDAKRDQARTEGRIQDLEELLQAVEIIQEHAGSTGVVRIGNTVTLRDAKGKLSTYTIVGSAEADPLKGRISNTSPVGKAILGKKTRESVTVQTPNGPIKLTITKIE
jgi:transcription elongation factor GreA